MCYSFVLYWDSLDEFDQFSDHEFGGYGLDEAHDFGRNGCHNDDPFRVENNGHEFTFNNSDEMELQFRGEVKMDSDFSDDDIEFQDSILNSKQEVHSDNDNMNFQGSLTGLPPSTLFQLPMSQLVDSSVDAYNTHRLDTPPPESEVVDTSSMGLCTNPDFGDQRLMKEFFTTPEGMAYWNELYPHLPINIRDEDDEKEGECEVYDPRFEWVRYDVFKFENNVEIKHKDIHIFCIRFSKFCQSK